MLENDINQLLNQYQAKTSKILTVGTVESATGGRVGDRITNVPGSSAYYMGSIVAYSNDVKIDVVGVKEETINSYGAVSPETAIEMAENGRKLLKTDLCLSDTGIAGPTGDTTEKPLGLFYRKSSFFIKPISKRIHTKEINYTIYIIDDTRVIHG